ncbi:hypothetical protein E0K89_016155 [Aquicoccus sp. SCR17]|nr:hypothetical protein [Carideicomes alvinocaridis]
MALPTAALRCLIAPGHSLMIAGAGLDYWHGGGGALCLSTPSFDPLLLIWLAGGCPAMLAGMAVGLALECVAGRSILSALAGFLAACLAMIYANAWSGGSAVVEVLAMVAAMVLADLSFRAVPAMRRQAPRLRAG